MRLESWLSADLQVRPVTEVWGRGDGQLPAPSLELKEGSAEASWPCSEARDTRISISG